MAEVSDDETGDQRTARRPEAEIAGRGDRDFDGADDDTDRDGKAEREETEAIGLKQDLIRFGDLDRAGRDKAFSDRKSVV